MIDEYTRKDFISELNGALQYARSLQFNIEAAINYCEPRYKESIDQLPPKGLCEELIYQILLFDDLKRTTEYLVSKYEIKEESVEEEWEE